MVGFVSSLCSLALKKKKAVQCNYSGRRAIIYYYIVPPRWEMESFFPFFFFFLRSFLYIFLVLPWHEFFSLATQSRPSEKNKTAASWKRVKFLFYRFCCCRSFHFLPPFCVFFSFLTSPFEWSAVPTIDFDLNEWQCHHQTVSFLLVNDVKKWKEKTKKERIKKCDCKWKIWRRW